MAVRWLATAATSVALAWCADVRVSGTIVDDNQVAVGGARVWIDDRAAVSDPRGAFVLSLDQPGDYRLNAQRAGFFLLRDRPVTLVAGDNDVTLVLNHQREVFDSVEVSSSRPAINPEEPAATQQIGAAEISGVPYPHTHDLRQALPLFPGVVRDSRGNVHLQGGGTDQTYWTLDGFNITDPLTGRFESRVGIDGVRTIQVDSSRYSAETGKGSAGAVQIRTGMGDDRWRPSATNFVPGVENRKGLIVADWTPRASIAGPIRRGRAWLFDSIDAQYEKNVVVELPEGQDRYNIWRGSNLLRAQVNLTPANILTAGWLANYSTAPRNGLTFLDPPETTVDRRARQHLISVKDQIYLGGGALVEVGYAVTRGFAREIPQGRELYVFTPDGRRGNYFLDSRRHSRRDQWLINAFLPSRGSHQLKAGLDFNRLTYYQFSDRHGIEFYRSDGTRSRRIEFFGNPALGRRNFEVAGYLQDRWKLRPNVLVEIGARVDWDQIVRHAAVSPRLSLAWAPRDGTKLAAGAGLFYDATNLRVLSRHLDQYALARYFTADGRGLQYGPAASVYLAEERGLRMPVYRSFSAGVEQAFPASVHLRFEYLRKRGRDGFTFANTLEPGMPPAPEELAHYAARAFDGIYQLRNLRTDVYDSFEVTTRRSFRRQGEILASYTRSRALSNAVVDVNIDDPILVGDNAGRMPWDAPNRLLSWGILSLTAKNSIAWLAEWRDGYPFNIVDDDSRLVGKVHERRYPAYFNVNLHFERKIALWGHRWAVRGGFNNLTDRLNPTVVNNNVSSRRFLQYSGGSDRALVMRIRWLGRN